MAVAPKISPAKIIREEHDEVWLVICKAAGVRQQHAQLNRDDDSEKEKGASSSVESSPQPRVPAVDTWYVAILVSYISFVLLVHTL